MVYDMSCGKCGKTHEVWGVLIADQHKPRPCETEGCDGEMSYDEMSTIRGQRTFRQEDINSYAERRMRGNKEWLGIQGQNRPLEHATSTKSEGGARHFPGYPGSQRENPKVWE